MLTGHKLCYLMEQIYSDQVPTAVVVVPSPAVAVVAVEAQVEGLVVMEQAILKEVLVLLLLDFMAAAVAAVARLSPYRTPQEVVEQVPQDVSSSIFRSQSVFVIL